VIQLKQQDSTDAPLPDLLLLLIDLQSIDMSIYIRRITNELTIIPMPEESMLMRIEDFFDELRTLLPGTCDGCGVWNMRRFETFWGAHPHFCKRCMTTAVTIFERHDKWPETEMPDTL